MSSSAESAALKIVRNTKLKTASVFIASLALVAWSVSNVMLVSQNDQLNRRLACRERIADDRDDAIGRGLAAVANDDSDELARQAQILIEIANEEQCR